MKLEDAFFILRLYRKHQRNKITLLQAGTNAEEVESAIGTILAAAPAILEALPDLEISTPAEDAPDSREVVKMG